MPNAAAMLDDDLGYDAPTRKKAARKPRTTHARRKKKGRRFNVSANQIARYGAIGMSAAVVVGILVNALLMQKGHHPAPLFGKGLALASTAVAQVPPAPASSTANMTSPFAAAEVPAPIEAAITARAPAPRAATDAASGDPIARLLDGSAPTSPTEKGFGARTVLGVQKALMRLGFAVKANGTFGPTTKKAIEAFEKDRHLPVKGELSRKIVKVLAAESGLRID